MIVAVTGASGWVGSAVCDWLRNNSTDVRPIVRRAILPGQHEWDSAGGKPNDLERAFKGADAVIHCAAHVHRERETAAEKEMFWKINVRGAGILRDTCAKIGVPRIVFAGTTAIYGNRTEVPWKESDQPNPCTDYARSKIEAENVLLDSKLDVRVARLATVFGRGDKANFLKLAQALRRRRFALPGSGSARKSVIDIRQAAEVLGRLALRTDPAPPIINLANPHAPTLNEICSAIASVCEFPPPISIPTALLRLMALGGSVIQMAVPRFPINLTNLRKLTSSTIVDSTLLQQLFPDIRWLSFSESMTTHATYYRNNQADTLQ